MSAALLRAALAGPPAAPRAVLVGELNPHGGRDCFALYPEPEGSAGGRLCRLVLGLGEEEYLRHYARYNLCAGRWSAPRARDVASALLREWDLRERVEWDDAGRPTGHWFTPFVLLGAKVAASYGGAYEPFTWRATPGGHPRRLFATLPHPSGLCRLWNAPGSFERARALLRQVGALPAPGGDAPPGDPRGRGVLGGSDS